MRYFLHPFHFTGWNIWCQDIHKYRENLPLQSWYSIPAPTTLYWSCVCEYECVNACVFVQSWVCVCGSFRDTDVFHRRDWCLAKTVFFWTSMLTINIISSAIHQLEFGWKVVPHFVHYIMLILINMLETIIQNLRGVCDMLSDVNWTITFATKQWCQLNHHICH